MSTQIRVARTVHASPSAIFALLADPSRHPAFDTSGMVRGYESGGADAVGDEFVMAMHNERRGDYRTVNTVVAREPDREIGWEPNVPDGDRLGHRYTFTLRPTADGTELTQVYDWSAMTDADVLARMPRVSRAELIASLGEIAGVLGDDDGDRGGRYLTAERSVDAAPAEVFALLADPHRHPEFDGSGTVLGAREAGPIGGVGEVFTMAMHGRDMGDYDVENHVVAYEPGRLVGWAPATPGGDRGGQTWTYRLTPEGSGTRVAHTYDWSAVRMERLLPYLPVVDAAGLEASLDRLADALTRATSA